MTLLRLLVLATLACGAAVARSDDTPPGAPSAADSAPATVQATWVEQKLRFVYWANTAYYSCDGLEGKIRSILAAIGARPGYTVQARGCFNPRRGAEWTPMVDITVATAREAGTAGPVGEGAGQPFPARVMRVDLRDSQTGLLQPGDCELVQQLRDQVLKPLGAKIVVDRMSCSVHTLNIDTITMSLEVLVPAAETPAPAG